MTDFTALLIFFYAEFFGSRVNAPFGFVTLLSFLVGTLALPHYIFGWLQISGFVNSSLSLQVCRAFCRRM